VSFLKNLKLQRERRLKRVRSRQFKRGEKPRVTVSRSLNHIHAQLIDDKNHITLLSCSTLSLKNLSGSKKEKARAVGIELGKAAIEKDVKVIFFDRGQYLYHGRVQALADGLREAGLQF